MKINDKLFAIITIVSFCLTANGCNFLKKKKSEEVSSDSSTESQPTKPVPDTNAPKVAKPVSSPSPSAEFTPEPDPSPEPSPVPSVGPSPEPSPSAKPSASPVPSPSPSAEPSPSPSPSPAAKPKTLDAWLDAHPTVRSAIRIETSTSTFLATNTLSEKSYTNWSDSEKQALRDAFDREWNWLYQTENPFQNLGKDEFTMPLPCPRCQANLASSPDVAPMTLIDNSEGLKVYYAFVAHALAVEIGGAVPWSVLDRPEGELHHYFNSRAMMHRYGPHFLFGESPWEPNLRIKNIGNATPATPRFIYSWMKNNGILKSNRTDTVIALLQWSRENLVHFIGYDSYQSAVDHWGVPSRPPVASVLNGTLRTPENYFPAPMHWTGGCHGTSGLFKEILRAVNIPVEVVRLCGHAQLYFPTERKYLSHSDDPYNQNVVSSHRETSDLLIDQATHTEWFSNEPDNLKYEDSRCDNIGRTAADF